MVVFQARGLVPPVFTALNKDKSVNYGIIPTYVQHLVSNGIKSVLIGGTTGEHMSLPVSERKKLVDAWVRAGQAAGLHIMVQVGGAPLADVLDLGSYCAASGVDSLLTLPELYFKPGSVDELVSYVEHVAKAAPTLPVLYYHIPSMTKVEINMPAFVVAATNRIPNFKGIKFTSNDLSEAAQVRRVLKDDQEIFLGADTLLAPAALLGIKSSIGTSFNLFPKLAQDILDAVEANDIGRARTSQEKLTLAIEAHTAEGAWVPVMKAGMELVTGITVGPPSLPQQPVSAEARSRIQEKIRGLGLFGGTTSENMCLSVIERKKLIDRWLLVNKSLDLGIHVMVQVGGAPFNDVIELTKYCASVGVNSILTLPELYFKPKTVENHVSFISQVADAAPTLPLIYYHSPDMTGVTINMVDFALAASARVPSFKGIKFASKDLVEAAQVKWALQDDQVLFIAGEILLAPAMLLGIDSCSSSASNIFPQLDFEILKAVKDGNIERARSLQKIVVRTIKQLEQVGDDWIAVAKAATEYVSGSLRLGPPCLPKNALSSGSRDNIHRIMDELCRSETISRRLTLS